MLRVAHLDSGLPGRATNADSLTFHVRTATLGGYTYMGTYATASADAYFQYVAHGADRRYPGVCAVRTSMPPEI